MRETALHDFFVGALSPAGLQEALADVVGRCQLVSGENLLLDLTHDVELETPDLVKLCDSFLKGDLKAQHLQAVAFFLIASEQFLWDTDTPEGNLLGKVLFDWSAPEINHGLGPLTVARFREGLLNGEYPFGT